MTRTLLDPDKEMVSDHRGRIRESQPDSHTASLIQMMPKIAKSWSCCQEDHAGLHFAHLQEHCLISGVPKLDWPLEDLNPGQAENSVSMWSHTNKASKFATNPALEFRKNLSDLMQTNDKSMRHMETFF